MLAVMGLSAACNAKHCVPLQSSQAFSLHHDVIHGADMVTYSPQSQHRQQSSSSTAGGSVEEVSGERSFCVGGHVWGSV